MILFIYKMFCNVFDVNFGLFVFGVKVNYFVNVVVEKYFFVDWKFGESIEDVVLNIVSGEIVVV